MKTFSTTLVDTIEIVWAAIRAHHPEVPEVIVTMGAGFSRHRQVLGQFHAGSWVRTTEDGNQSAHELFVGGEGLAQGAHQVLVTLLHEAAHGVAHTRGVKDTSRQGRWHNSHFRAIAAELGVATTKSHRLGWSDSSLADGVADAYADQLTELQAALTAHRRTFTGIPLSGGSSTTADGDVGDEPGAGDTKSSNGHALACPCDRKIRASTKVAGAGPILCGLCGGQFVTAPPPETPATNSD